MDCVNICTEYHIHVKGGIEEKGSGLPCIEYGLQFISERERERERVIKTEEKEKEA